MRHKELNHGQKLSLFAKIFGLTGGIALIVSWFLLNMKATKGIGDIIGNLGWLSLAISFYNWVQARNIIRKQVPKNPKKD